MSKKDTLTKKYMQDNERFADAFNFYVYDGKQVIKPENLKEVDTTEIAIPYGDDSESVTVQKYRDILKLATIMCDGKNTYVLLGVENQSEIHNAMSVRSMLYDALQYAAQVERVSKSHRRNGNKTKNKAEFLSGFYSNDKLTPVITLTLYFGAEQWTGARDLHSMMDADEEILRYVENYHLHLISPSEIGNENFSKFHSDLSTALKYIKYSKSKNELNELTHSDPAFRSVSRETAELISGVTNSNIKYDEKEECIDMCKAIEDMMADSRAEGKAEGRAEGMIQTLVGLAKKGILTMVQAAEEANMSVEEFEKLLK